MVDLLTDIETLENAVINLTEGASDEKRMAIHSLESMIAEKKASFEAEDGCHDDLVMCLVMYAWAVAQDYFREMTDQSVREELYEKDKRQLEEDMSPFGFVVDGTEDEVIVEKEKGLVWTMATEFDDPRWDRYRDKVDNIPLDGFEYGATQGDWYYQ